MAESVVISNIKENILEFDAEVKGIKDPKLSVNFVIKTDIVDLSFKAKHERDNTWSAVIPPMKMLKLGDTHPYMITVVVEGYHFEPMTGTVEIVGEVKATVSKPTKKSTAKPEEKKVEPKEEKKVEDKPEEKKVVKDEEEEKEVKETVSPLDQTIDKIITRETLRKSPSDIAIRKVLDEVKKAPVPEPVVVPSETPEQIAQRLAEETRLAEQAAREAAVKNILKGMSGTKATIRN